MPEYTAEKRSIAVVGATGAVGAEVLSILQQRGCTPDQIRCYGSERSAGNFIPYGGSELTVHPLEQITADPPDFALLCADATTARRVLAMMGDAKSVLIDNSSAFRMESDVPLVIPEVNGETVVGSSRLIANPNCSTIMLVRAIDPLKRAFGLRGITVTTYQAVSGAGRAGIDELYEQTSAAIDGRTVEPSVFPVTCAFNVFEHESEIDPESGFNGEETKMVLETRRILASPDLPVLPTCVRVPVERAHAQSVIVDLDRAVTVEMVRETLVAGGVALCPAGSVLTPRLAAGKEDVVVGRVRLDPSSDGNRVLLWICCDQIRKGAAMNAVQLMDLSESRGR